jgi:signal transduction histidine kinase
MAKFTVDTHLFRELGELLVGRDSTALIELIKNSYDADATDVTVYGDTLEDTESGSITIVDNGIGMTPEEFESGFLRVASRLKEEGNRKSQRYDRRYTGAKGIGRLAAHKLARVIEINSIPWRSVRGTRGEGVRATINWDVVESVETLDQLEGTTAIRTESVSVSTSAGTGTTITLRKLRREWTKSERGRFIAEVQSFQPPLLLVDPPRDVFKAGLLFEKATVHDVRKSIDPFNVTLEGEFAPSDDYWGAFAQAADWLIEIDSSKNDGLIRYQVTPTTKLTSLYPDARERKLTTDRPTSNAVPSLQARILIREGQATGPKDFKSWASTLGGIRIFQEGFRVLPYGERNNDWLSLDADYTGRTRKLTWIQGQDIIPEEPDEDEGLLVLPNKNYFGAVFLTQSGAPLLRLLVNREGFVPDAAFDQIVAIVRTGIDLCTRVRAATKHETRIARREQRAAARGNVGFKKGLSSEVDFEKAIRSAKSIVVEARELAARGDIGNAEKKIAEAASKFEDISLRSTELISEGSLLRVLASVGTQMAAFIHEINSLLGMAEGVEGALSRISKDATLPRSSRQELIKLQKSLGDLRRRLERQASYLVDVVTPDARRRRSRQSLADRFNAGARLVQSIADRRGIAIEDDIPPELKSPPMFPAELTTIFSNLLTNAVKAAGENGRIRATGQPLDDGSKRIVVENTGVAVIVDEAERWFKPFESTTTALDPVLGQGMGLGLPITRNMLEQYGAEVRFVRPSRGFSTAVEIVFPR